LVEEGAEAVVLGFDTTLTYAKLERAAHLLRAGAAFFATNPDRVCPTERGPIPDCGSMIALLRTATGAEPTVIGKPEALMVEMALEKLGGIGAERVGLVGDRLYTDIRMANRCGLTAGPRTVGRRPGRCLGYLTTNMPQGSSGGTWTSVTTPTSLAGSLRRRESAEKSPLRWAWRWASGS